MSKAQEIMLVRHPQTEWNHAGRYIGRGDSPLSPSGQGQVHWLRRVVAAWEPEVTYTSPLGRAKNTAIAITPHGTRVEVLDDLQEIDFGQVEGMTYEQMAAAGIRLDYESGGPVAPDGESATDFRERVTRVAGTIQAAGDRTLVVTHGGVMRHLLTYWLGLPFSAAWRFSVPNASISVVRIAEGTGVLEGLTPPPEDPAHRPERRRRPWHL